MPMGGAKPTVPPCLLPSSSPTPPTQKSPRSLAPPSALLPGPIQSERPTSWARIRSSPLQLPPTPFTKSCIFFQQKAQLAGFSSHKSASSRVAPHQCLSLSRRAPGTPSVKFQSLSIFRPAHNSAIARMLQGRPITNTQGHLFK